jgi:toxin ParE1/3/4
MGSIKRPVVWSFDAENDLDRIWSYYLEISGGVLAEKILKDIGNVIALLEDHPLAGRSREEVWPELRSMAASPHVIFYRVTDTNIQIVRVLDGRRDIDSIFETDKT